MVNEQVSIITFILYRALVLYLSPALLLNFLSNLYISPWLGNIFKFVVLRLLEIEIES